jgi:hypothetical protein
VRRVAPEWLAFVEGALMVSEQGTKLDLGRHAGLVYFPHFYDKRVHVTKAYDGRHEEMDAALDVYAADARRFGVPWMLGEYGVTPDTSGAVPYLRDQERALSSRRAGGTCWHYNPTDLEWNDEGLSLVLQGGVETPLVDAFVRPYPQAVAGEIARFDFDDDTRAFELSWTPRGASGETVVFAPRRHYPNGAKLELSAGSYEWDGERLVVRAPTQASQVSLRLKA